MKLAPRVAYKPSMLGNLSKTIASLMDQGEVNEPSTGNFVLSDSTYEQLAQRLKSCMMPELYAQTFAALGERMQDHLDLRRIDPTYHLTFPDDSQLQLTSDLQQMRRSLEAIEPGSFERMLHYLGEGRPHL